MPAIGRCRQRRWPRATSCRRVISNRCCRRWCATASSRAFAARAAATSWRASRGDITADDILRAASAAEEAAEPPLPGTPLLNRVVLPALSEAERMFSAALGRINVEDMARQAQALK